ncbi:hypothetical protein ACTJK5_09780 [Agrobacterium sp. 22094]
MKFKQIVAEARRWSAVDWSPREPDYTSRRGWRRVLWKLVHSMEHWYRPF